VQKQLFNDKTKLKWANDSDNWNTLKKLGNGKHELKLNQTAKKSDEA